MVRRILHLTNPEQHNGQDKTHPIDVTYTQRLLAGQNVFHQNFHPGPIDGTYGMLSGQAAKRAKWLLGYPKAACDMQVGNTLRGYLTGEEKLPLSYRVRRKLRNTPIDKTLAPRQHMVAHARFLIAHASSVHYSQGSSRLANLAYPDRLPMWSDCSASITCICRWSGAPDPNGFNFHGGGYTGTFLRHCHRISKQDARAGDFVVWGTGTGHHVAMVIEPGNDPLLYSHGSENGPLAIKFSNEHAAQSRMGHSYTTWLTDF